MNLELYTDAAVATDLPESNLRRGDMVKIVDELTAPDGARGYAVEVLNALGETIDVRTVPASALEPLREDDLLCIRRLVAVS